MAGTVSSLGIGSSVLTADVIDKLKANDVANMITPLDNKITYEKQKKSALDLLNSLLTSFKGSVSALDNDALYQKRSVSGGNDYVGVSAESGVSIQSFSISNTVLAQKNVLESGSFSAATAKVATGSGTMSLSIDGETFDIDYTDATTLEDLKNSINTIAGDKIKATTLQVGADDYRLVLTSAETGANQTITISDSAAGALNNTLLSYDETLNPDGVKEIQAARDASFKYNGISITRSTNTIDDIITGVTLQLKGETTTVANISISQNVDAINEEMNGFVSNYNTLISQLDSMTTSDTKEGKVGIFNGDNTINAIKREISRYISTSDENGYSLAVFGIDLKEDGTMTFDASTFSTKFQEDSTLAEQFLSGSSTTDANGDLVLTDGIFTSFTALMDRYTSSKGLISNLVTASSSELTSLEKNKTRTQALLDARYEAMASKFAQYDAIISKINNQFAALQQQIDAMANDS